MNPEINKILQDAISWKNSKNIAHVRKAKKLETYLQDFQAGELTENDLKKLLDQLSAIDRMNYSAEEMKISRKINDAISAVKDLFK